MRGLPWDMVSMGQSEVREGDGLPPSDPSLFGTEYGPLTVKSNCRCYHPPHIGFVCGYPIPYAEKDGRIIDGVICGCEG